ncbi:11156_t:CDS:2 [Cetraspora pellucida]|uniref:11156_t:CDS:1 n=1 Tax=Cetraspora pellucida TaxID=1433469 RepID=A0ACA9KVX1_9GLOM|nr:11156_t:CDS:2 [Cetraspora pellucida]
MGAIELKFQGTFNKSDYLQEFSCGICQQYITEQDISKGNYRLWVSDYANEVEKDETLGMSGGGGVISLFLHICVCACLEKDIKSNLKKYQLKTEPISEKGLDQENQEPQEEKLSPKRIKRKKITYG